MPTIALYTWLSVEPPILFHTSAGDGDVGHYLPDEPIYRLVNYLWHQAADEIAAYHERWRTLKPRHRLLHLVNDPQIREALVARDIPAWFINQNAFLDETLFTIDRGATKAFDAVYNARMAPFKRHALLSEVSRPLVIGGVIADDDSQAYFDEVRATLPHATFTHYPESRHLDAFEIRQLLNVSRVGLCLSEVEGAMYAAVEYLLCGLPVVSTRNEGGRDVWLDAEFSRTVEPDPKQVAAAVNELAARDIPPEAIRAGTIARITEHRQRFVSLGQEIYKETGTGRDFARDFYASFHNKVGRWRPTSDVLRYRDE